MIDSEGYRANVGIIVSNHSGKLFWCKRVGQDAWQFPQGGIRDHETPREAMFRELQEETGLMAQHVEVIGATKGWLRYQLPKHLIRHHIRPCCVGQKQVWYLLRLTGGEECVDLRSSHNPEFDRWRWVDYWRPAREVIFFKRRVYELALKELAPLLFESRPPARPGRLR